jgi:hypothetical protein
MSDTENVLPDVPTHYYIGSDDCKKATCNERQEFPESDDPYCFHHSIEAFHDNL